MENKTKLGTIGLIVLCLTVSALFGIAYAGFTSNLYISGQATVSSTKWDVKFSSITRNTTLTTSGLTISNIPTIGASGDTTISGWEVSFTEPGQVAAFDIVVTNFGDFDAKYSGGTDLTTLAPTCKVGNDSTATSAVNVCNNVTIEFKKGNSTLSTSNASLLSASTHGTETYTLIVSYNVNAGDTTGSSLPTDTVTVTVPQITLTYNQQV